MPVKHKGTHVPRILALTVLALCVTDSRTNADKPAKTLKGLPLVFSDDFESGKLDRWQPTDKSAWKISTQKDNRVYSLTKKRSKFEPPVRSPYNRSLVRDIRVRSFVLDVRLQSTIPDYDHRDLCLFFGYQDDSHLYYVHLGKKTDDHANQIFIVNEKPRTKISTRTTKGTNWGKCFIHGGHHGRLHVIEKNFDAAGIRVPDDARVMPCIVPVRA